jgi:hypothetical protein
LENIPAFEKLKNKKFTEASASKNRFKRDIARGIVSTTKYTRLRVKISPKLSQTRMHPLPRSVASHSTSRRGHSLLCLQPNSASLLPGLFQVPMTMSRSPTMQPLLPFLAVRAGASLPLFFGGYMRFQVPSLFGRELMAMAAVGQFSSPTARIWRVVLI